MLAATGVSIAGSLLFSLTLILMGLAIIGGLSLWRRIALGKPRP